MANEQFPEVFAQLKALLARYESELVIVHDDDGNYYLDTSHLMKNKKPLFFAAAQVGKRYVSFHLMPVYLWPQMLEQISPALRKHMQGKSCFNFKRVEPDLFEELSLLTSTGFERYREAGYLE